jgi:hypothetical protein
MNKEHMKFMKKAQREIQRWYHIYLKREYTYITLLLCQYLRCPWTFSPSRSMLWVERALAFVGVLRESSLSLACPFHCGASWLPAFLAGFASGVSLVLCLVFYLFLIRFPLWTLPSPTASAHSPPPASPIIRHRSRLSGYVHER